MSEPMAYIAKRPECGCVAYLVVDDPLEKEDIRTLARLMKKRHIIERVPVADINNGKISLERCSHKLRRSK